MKYLDKSVLKGRVLIVEKVSSAATERQPEAFSHNPGLRWQHPRTQQATLNHSHLSWNCYLHHTSLLPAYS